jgi:hypothetical protein
MTGFILGVPLRVCLVAAILSPFTVGEVLSGMCPCSRQQCPDPKERHHYRLDGGNCFMQRRSVRLRTTYAHLNLRLSAENCINPGKQSRMVRLHLQVGHQNLLLSWLGASAFRPSGYDNPIQSGERLCVAEF